MVVRRIKKLIAWVVAFGVLGLLLIGGWAFANMVVG